MANGTTFPIPIFCEYNYGKLKRLFGEKVCSCRNILACALNQLWTNEKFSIRITRSSLRHPQCVYYRKNLARDVTFIETGAATCIWNIFECAAICYQFMKQMRCAICWCFFFLLHTKCDIPIIKFILEQVGIQHTQKILIDAKICPCSNIPCNRFE